MRFCHPYAAVIAVLYCTAFALRNLICCTALYCTMYMYTAQYSTRRADGWLVVSGAGEMRNVSEVYAGMKRAPNIVTIGLLPWGALSDPEARRLVRPAPGPRPALPRPPPARTALPSLY